MYTRNLSPEERYELILECRSSGLTDHQWLEEHGIRKSTFYNWISTFRKKGYPNIPEPLRQHSCHKPQVQAKDVQFQELKDMIAQLNNTIRTQSKTIDAMTNMLAEKDQRLAELTEELRILRQKLFGYSKERSAKLANSDQFNMLAELGLEPEPEPELVDAEFIEVKAHKKAKKSKATFDEQFEGLRVEQVIVDTLSDEDKTCPNCGTKMKPIGTERIRRDVVHVKQVVCMADADRR